MDVYAHVNIWRLTEAGATHDDSGARELAARLREQPGFRSYMLVRSGEREVIAVTVFDSEEQLERALASVADFVQRRITPLVAGAPERRRGEVLYHAAV
jgi:heme-degrading monooxygenase HmoA